MLLERSRKITCADPGAHSLLKGREMVVAVRRGHRRTRSREISGATLAVRLRAQPPKQDEATRSKSDDLQNSHRVTKVAKWIGPIDHGTADTRNVGLNGDQPNSLVQVRRKRH